MQYMSNIPKSISWKCFAKTPPGQPRLPEYVWLEYMYARVCLCTWPSWCVLVCLHTTSHTTDQHTSRWSSTKTYSSIHILKPNIFWKSGLTRGRFCETFSENWLWNIGHVLHLNSAMSWVCLPYPNDHLCPNNFVRACRKLQLLTWFQYWWASWGHTQRAD